MQPEQGPGAWLPGGGGYGACECNQIGDILLDIGYGGDKKLEKLCTDEKEMRRRRSDIADKLRLRIKALEEASCVGELETVDPLGRWHRLDADWHGHWAGSVSRNHRIIVRPDGDGLDTDSVSVTVVEAGIDYH